MTNTQRIKSVTRYPNVDIKWQIIRLEITKKSYVQRTGFSKSANQVITDNKNDNK